MQELTNCCHGFAGLILDGGDDFDPYPIYLSIYLTIYLSILFYSILFYLSIYLFYLSIYLSIIYIYICVHTHIYINMLACIYIYFRYVYITLHPFYDTKDLLVHSSQSKFCCQARSQSARRSRIQWKPVFPRVCGRLCSFVKPTTQ